MRRYSTAVSIVNGSVRPYATTSAGASSCTAICTPTITLTLNAAPMRATSRARRSSPAPAFCAAAVVMAWPMAQHGSPAMVLICRPTPAAAATSVP